MKYRRRSVAARAASLPVPEPATPVQCLALALSFLPVAMIVLQLLMPHALAWLITPSARDAQHRTVVRLSPAVHAVAQASAPAQAHAPL